MTVQRDSSQAAEQRMLGAARDAPRGEEIDQGDAAGEIALRQAGAARHAGQGEGRHRLVEHCRRGTHRGGQFAHQILSRRRIRREENGGARNFTRDASDRRATEDRGNAPNQRGNDRRAGILPRIAPSKDATQRSMTEKA